jgi:hypothetical protein
MLVRADIQAPGVTSLNRSENLELQMGFVDYAFWRSKLSSEEHSFPQSSVQIGFLYNCRSRSRDSLILGSCSHSIIVNRLQMSKSRNYRIFGGSICDKKRLLHSMWMLLWRIQCESLLTAAKRSKRRGLRLQLFIRDEE